MPEVIDFKTNYFVNEKNMGDAFFNIILTLPSNIRLFDKYGDYKYIEFGFSSTLRKFHIYECDYTQFTTASIFETQKYLFSPDSPSDIFLMWCLRVYLYDGDDWEESEAEMAKCGKEYWSPYLSGYKSYHNIHIPKYIKEKIYVDFDDFRKQYWMVENSLKKQAKLVLV
jgi:hypothetical protein